MTYESIDLFVLFLPSRVNHYKAKYQECSVMYWKDPYNPRSYFIYFVISA